MKTIKGQTLFSTLEDSQGERRDKQFLEEMISRMPPRFPLGQHHDASLPHTGYIENFRLEEIPDQQGEWRIIGDVTMEDDQDWSQGGGFSYSTVEITQRQFDGIGALYVPYPFYRDPQVINEILSYNPKLHAGRWIKKAADPTHITLIVTLTLWVLTPLWKKAFDEKVWPFLEGVLANYRKGRLKDMPFDYGSTVLDKNGKEVNILFVPDRKNTNGTFTKELVKNGLQKAIKMITEDKKGALTGISLVKLYYSNQSNDYIIDSIQYVDGSVIYHVE